MIEYKIKFEFDENALNSKLSNIVNDQSFMTEVHQDYAQTIDPWTPFLTGKLHTDISIDSTGVTYRVPYAAKKYYGTVYCKSFHPLATSHWDEIAMQTEKDSFTARFKEKLLRRAKEIYG